MSELSTEEEAFLAEVCRRPPGRPRIATPEWTEALLTWIAQGRMLTHFCELPDSPSMTTVYNWLRKDKEFAAAYAHAREVGFDVLAEACLDIADDSSQDTMHTEQGERCDTEWVARSKLRIWTRLELLKRWDPKRYGEMQKIAVGGDKDAPPIQLTEVQRAAKVRSIIAVAVQRKQLAIGGPDGSAD